jgi:hypothetical protein
MANVTLPEDQERRGNKAQGWLQSDKDAHKAMWQLGVKHPSALSVLHFMISKMSRGTNGVIISAAALSRQMGISPRTAQGAVAVLQQNRFVQILKTGNANVYIINAKVAWQGHRGMRYASFNAQLVIDEQEQVKTVEEVLRDAEGMIDVPIMEMVFDPEDEPLENETDPRQRDLLK